MKGRIKYDVMTKDELNHMKSRMEELLIKRGIHLDHDEMLTELSELGCIVDMETKQLKFTKKLIDKAIASVPKEFTLYSPSGKRDLKFPHPEGKFYVRTNTGAPNYMTVDGDTHFTKISEVDEWYHIANQMENVDYFTLPSTSGEEVPGDAVDVYTLERALNLAEKHIWLQPYEGENVKYLIDMAAASVGGLDKLRERPIVSFIACSVSCLNYKRMDAEILYRCAKAGLPVQPCSLPTAGANTPVTAQGTAFMAASEVFAMIVMLQLLSPGLPVIATTLLFSMDMMTTYTLQSNTEITMARLICMQLFEQGYNIRAHSYGTGTDSLAIDEQNMIERTSLIHSMAMSDASVLGGAGQLETAKTISPIQLIIDNEIFGIAQRLRTGLEINDDYLGWNEIMDEVDKSPGFIMSDHTMKHFEESHRPDMFNRGGLSKWEENGSKTLQESAVEKYHKLIKNPATYSLDPEKLAAVKEVLKKAHKALVKEQ